MAREIDIQSESNICMVPTIKTEIRQSIKTQGIGMISGQIAGGEPVVALL
jgi:hypothetical protein